MVAPAAERPRTPVRHRGGPAVAPPGEVAPGGRVALAGAGHPCPDGGLEVLLARSSGSPSAAAGPDPTRHRTPAATKKTCLPAEHPRGPDPLCPRTAGGVGNRLEGVAWGSPDQMLRCRGCRGRAAPPPRRGCRAVAPSRRSTGGSSRRTDRRNPEECSATSSSLTRLSSANAPRLLRRQRLSRAGEPVVDPSGRGELGPGTAPVAGAVPVDEQSRPRRRSRRPAGTARPGGAGRRRTRRCRRRRAPARPAGDPWTHPARPAAGGPVRGGRPACRRDARSRRLHGTGAAPVIVSTALIGVAAPALTTASKCHTVGNGS